jgi:signal transduction histidine kinase
VLNAIQHSPNGGTITLLGRVEAGTLHLSILDEGPGLTAEAVADAKQSLHRSHGLGLTLARRLLAPYGGTIELCNRSDGVRGAATHLAVSAPE